jgi:hypothetical protein
MTGPDGRIRPDRKRLLSLPVVVSVAVVGLLIVLLANAHLVYVAFTSQPDCVAHIKASEVPAPRGSFSAANSAC